MNIKLQKPSRFRPVVGVKIRRNQIFVTLEYSDYYYYYSISKFLPFVFD